MHKATQKKLVTSVAAAALLFGLAACDNNETEGESEGAAAEESAPEQQGGEGQEGMEQPEMPEPDLGDVPDVVAEVNGSEISGEDYSQAYEASFSQMAMQSQMTGEEVDEESLQEETLDNLIGYELLTQEADDRGYEASEEDIDAELEQTAEANGVESVDELFEMAQEQGVEEDDLRADVEQQVLINQIVDDLDVEEPTDEEVEETYEEFTAQQPPAEGEDGEEAETPDLDEMRGDIEEQLTAEKENEAVLAHIDELREDAEVETHV